MSTQLDVFIVDESAIHAVIKDRDLSIIDKIEKKFGSATQLFGSEMSGIDIGLAFIGRPPIFRAFKNIIYANIAPRPSAGFYISAYYALCQYFALKTFQDWNQVARSAQWLGSVDSALTEANLKVDLLKLVYGPTNLLGIPCADPDEVNTGFWNADDVVQNKLEIEKYFARDYFETPEDPFRELGYPLHDIHKWLTQAVQHQNAVLVGFYF